MTVWLYLAFTDYNNLAVGDNSYLFSEYVLAALMVPN